MGLTPAQYEALRRALNQATVPGALDPAIDRALRAQISAHTGFREVAAVSDAIRSPQASERQSADRQRWSLGAPHSQERRDRHRWLVRGSLTGGALAAAALLVLWLSGSSGMLLGTRSTNRAVEAPLSSRIENQLREAVQLARSAAPAPRGAVDPRVAALLAAIVASGAGDSADNADSAGNADEGADSRTANARFKAFDLFVDAPGGVDGVVLDLVLDDPHGEIVGLGSGEAPFEEPPTYDAARLATGRVRIATIPAHSATGRLRVATISIRCSAAEPTLTATAVSAVVDRDGNIIDAPVTWTVTPRSTP